MTHNEARHFAVLRCRGRYAPDGGDYLRYTLPSGRRETGALVVEALLLFAFVAPVLLVLLAAAATAAPVFFGIRCPGGGAVVLEASIALNRSWQEVC